MRDRGIRVPLLVDLQPSVSGYRLFAELALALRRRMTSAREVQMMWSFAKEIAQWTQRNTGYTAITSNEDRNGQRFLLDQNGRQVWL